MYFAVNQICNPPTFKPTYYDLRHKNARGMKKAILLSKRTSSLPQGLHAPQRSHGLHPARTAKKDKGSTSKAEDNPIVECTKYGALKWTSESTGKDFRTGELTFTICCNHGQIKLPPINQPPPMLEELLQHRWFRDTIRVYNSVLAFTSIGMKMDYTVVNAPGPYTIRIQGQTHHRIGSLIPRQGRPPEYLQLYIFDTGNELFRRARDYYEGSRQEFNIRLLSDKGKGKEYDLPSTSEQIRDDHPLYMSLQYPLLFPRGEYGFHPEISLHLETGTSKTRQFLTIRQYYAAQIQTRLSQGMTLVKGGRLLHQYVVDVYTAIEEDRLRFILPPSFTGGPRYLIYGGDSPNDRPDIECRYVVKNGATLNNTFVVPHNINLLKKYEAHINVEWCNRTSAVKYLFKYITKGVDRASAVIEKGNTATTSDTVASGEPKEKVIKQRNEIQEYIEARYLSACESMWRTFAFHIHKRKPSHNITIKETDNLGRVIHKPGIEKTMFTEWMVLCRRSAFARTLTYVQIPEYFVWNNNSKVWSERKKGKTIGRIVAVHPSAGDRYYLRILINKIKGPRSYDELKTFNDVKYPDFKSVCHARGYLDDDVEWLESMSEGARTATPYQLRDMFVTFLNTCFVASPKGLWEHSWKSMSEDILHKRQRILGHTNLELDDETLEQYTLIEVEKLMRMQDRSLNDIKEMPKIKHVLLKELGN
ncbi:unnamed protein product, partial [Brassica rapa subsp. narinosa]